MLVDYEVLMNDTLMRKLLFGLLILALTGQVAMAENSNPMKWDPKGEAKPISQDEIKAKLSPEQYKVVCENGTERPFQNEYWDKKDAGIYVDRVSGEPLFSSADKYDSGSGWPSFTKPIKKDVVTEVVDRSLFMERTEVRSKLGNSHLGHVFPDGPGPEGTRYCMNSASLRFVPVNRLAEEGYGEFLSLFSER